MVHPLVTDLVLCLCPGVYLGLFIANDFSVLYQPTEHGVGQIVSSAATNGRVQIQHIRYLDISQTLRIMLQQFQDCLLDLPQSFTC